MGVFKGNLSKGCLNGLSKGSLQRISSLGKLCPLVLALWQLATGNWQLVTGNAATTQRLLHVIIVREFLVLPTSFTLVRHDFPFVHPRCLVEVYKKSHKVCDEKLSFDRGKRAEIDPQVRPDQRMLGSLPHKRHVLVAPSKVAYGRCGLSLLWLISVVAYGRCGLSLLWLIAAVAYPRCGLSLLWLIAVVAYRCCLLEHVKPIQQPFHRNHSRSPRTQPLWKPGAASVETKRGHAEVIPRWMAVQNEHK